jgi:hypothetical protein
MRKPKLLVHPSQCRTIENPVEVERLLNQNWLLAKPRPKTEMAKRMRLLRAQRRDQGWLSLLLWIPPDQIAELKAALRPNEGYAELLIRLVRKQSLF